MLSSFLKRFGWSTPNDLIRLGTQLLKQSQENGEQLFTLNQKLTLIMASIDQLTQDVQDESTLEDSIITLLTNVQTQLQDALKNAQIPADVQAKIDATFAQLEANKAKLAAAVASNTPAAPSTPGATNSDGSVTSVIAEGQV